MPFGRRYRDVALQDGTLRAMARARPADLEALSRIPGVGNEKLRRYGIDKAEFKPHLNGRRAVALAEPPAAGRFA